MCSARTCLRRSGRAARLANRRRLRLERCARDSAGQPCCGRLLLHAVTREGPLACSRGSMVPRTNRQRRLRRPAHRPPTTEARPAPAKGASRRQQRCSPRSPAGLGCAASIWPALWPGRQCPQPSPSAPDPHALTVERPASACRSNSAGSAKPAHSEARHAAAIRELERSSAGTAAPTGGVHDQLQQHQQPRPRSGAGLLRWTQSSSLTAGHAFIHRAGSQVAPASQPLQVRAACASSAGSVLAIKTACVCSGSPLELACRVA